MIHIYKATGESQYSRGCMGGDIKKQIFFIEVRWSYAINLFRIIENRGPSLRLGALGSNSKSKRRFIIKEGVGILVRRERLRSRRERPLWTKNPVWAKRVPASRRIQNVNTSEFLRSKNSEIFSRKRLFSTQKSTVLLSHSDRQKIH
jgi:hypothetical protein